MSEPRRVIYVVTSAIDGLVKIGKISTDRFEARMQYLESNGYSNITGLQRLAPANAMLAKDFVQDLLLLVVIIYLNDNQPFALDEYLYPAAAARP